MCIAHCALRIARGADAERFGHAAWDSKTQPATPCTGLGAEPAGTHLIRGLEGVDQARRPRSISAAWASGPRGSAPRRNFQAPGSAPIMVLRNGTDQPVQAQRQLEVQIP